MLVLPFSATQFFDVFAHYNVTVWPAPLVAYALGAIAFVAALRGGSACDRIAAVVLSAFWLWTGIAYHWLAFAAINRAAWAFGALFVAQGTLLFWLGVAARRLNFKYRHDLAGVAGILFVVYAAVLYPVVGLAAGHVYPRAPMFGITPCPVTIFTLGLLLLARPIAWAATIVPLLWSMVGGSAAFLLDVPQDWFSLFSGPLAVGLLWHAAKTRPPAAG